MAAKQTTSSTVRVKAKITRPGVHTKSKNSRSKSSKNYRKAYAGQGR